MKINVCLVALICMLVAVGPAGADDKLSTKWCVDDSVVGVAEHLSTETPIQLTDLDSAWRNKCKKTCPGWTWILRENGKCCQIFSRWTKRCKPAQVKCGYF